MKTPEIFTVAEMTAIMTATEQEMVPYMSIGASLFFLRRLYSEWLKRGGLKSYHPPGFEPKDEPDADAASR